MSTRPEDGPEELPYSLLEGAASNQADRPKVAHVTIEEIPGDLMSGVSFRVMHLGDDSTTPVLKPQPNDERCFYRLLPLTSRGPDGSYLVPIESFVKEPYNFKNPPWLTLSVCGVELVDTADSRTTGKKFVKINQVFKTRVSKPTAAYIQLICDHYRVRLHDRFYNRGDIVTVFLRNEPEQPGQAAPLIVVRPEHDQIFVPMAVGQKLQVVTDPREERLEWRQITGGSLKYESQLDIDGPEFGSDLYRMNYFIYSRRTLMPETVAVSYRDSSYMVINVCSPVGGNAHVYQPTGTSLVYTQGLQGVKIWTLNYLPLRVHEDCPARLVYVFNGKYRNEYKVALTVPCAQILLEKHNDEWLVKLP